MVTLSIFDVKTEKEFSVYWNNALVFLKYLRLLASFALCIQLLVWSD